ncbi:MAG TPA: hypothetical protein VJH97_02875 [Candidatus Nanoarchaeia archaeon]|nr:hypothetical protein [Candidatus Nanoarchaeia archaeon]
MNCSHCNKEDRWLEVIGKDFICKKCLNKNKIMGQVYRTHMNTFQFLIRKINPADYAAFLAITRLQVEKFADLKKQGISLKTTNVVELK